MAVSKSIAKLANMRAEADMTPVIDVTFLLLIFFMCTLHFKTLEGVLQAHLPEAINGKEKRSEDPIHIRIVKATKSTTTVCFDDMVLEGNNKYKTLFQKIKTVVDYNKNLGSDIAVIIDPDIDVPFQDIISTLNVCRRVDSVHPDTKPLKVSFAAKTADLDSK